MMKYVSVAEMVAIEKESDANGHIYSQMMEYAGRGLAEITRDAYSHLVVRKALGLVGSGNNGGDTLVAFCYLLEWGWQTTAYVVRPRPDGDPLVRRFLDAGGKLIEVDQGSGHATAPVYIIDDRILVGHELFIAIEVHGIYAAIVGFRHLGAPQRVATDTVRFYHLLVERFHAVGPTRIFRLAPSFWYKIRIVRYEGRGRRIYRRVGGIDIRICSK